MRPDPLMHKDTEPNFDHALPLLHPLPLALPDLLRSLTKRAHLYHLCWEPDVEEFLGAWCEAREGRATGGERD